MQKSSSREEYERRKAELQVRTGQPVSAREGRAARPASGTDDSEKTIQQAWQLGVACGIFTLIAALIAISGHPIFGYTAWNLLDAAFIFLLSFGVYRKSRTSALLLFLYYVISKILFVMEDRQYAGIAAAVVFSYYFMRGVQGTFVYQRARGENGYGAAWMPIVTASLGAGLLVALVVLGRPAGYSFAASAVKKAPLWTEVAPADAGFLIQMPGEPIKSSETVTLENGAGTMQITIYRRQISPKNSFAVLVYDIPERAGPDVDPYALFKSAVDADAELLKGKLVDEKVLTLGKWPGKEVRIENDQAALRALMFLVDGRFYRVVAYQEKARISSEDVERFLSSFKVTTTDGQIVTAHDPTIVTWLQFSPEGGRFSVELPGTPVASQENVSTGAGPMTVYRFEFKSDMFKEKLSVEYADYPEQLLRKLKSVDVVLTNAGSADIENFRGTLVSQNTLTADPYPGKELNVENAEAVMRIRMYIAGGRFYKIAAVAPRNVLSTADDERFMNSFRIITDDGGRR